MLYLTGCLPAKPHLRQQLLDNGFGVLLTPWGVSRTPSVEWKWAADNGCFSPRWEEARWLRWITNNPAPETALFATIPDVVGDHAQTLERWPKYASMVKAMGYKTAFVLQDGASIPELPLEEMDALFIGGSTEYKLSEDARRIVQHCKDAGKWIHMGRVNSARRIKIAYSWGCDSVDGTYLAFGPDANTPRLIQMMNRAHPQPTLF